MASPSMASLPPRWALALRCQGSRNVLSALRKAVEVDFKDKDKHQSQGLYLFTGGVPDQDMVGRPRPGRPHPSGPTTSPGGPERLPCQRGFPHSAPVCVNVLGAVAPCPSWAGRSGRGLRAAFPTRPGDVDGCNAPWPHPVKIQNL